MVVGGYKGGAHDKGVPDISRTADLADIGISVSQSNLHKTRTTSKRIEKRLECCLAMYLTFKIPLYE